MTTQYHASGQGYAVGTRVVITSKLGRGIIATITAKYESGRGWGYDLMDATGQTYYRTGSELKEAKE